MPYFIQGNPPRRVINELPFTIGEGADAIQYPRNYLKYSTPEEREAMGVYWENDPEPPPPPPPPPSEEEPAPPTEEEPVDP